MGVRYVVDFSAGGCEELFDCAGLKRKQGFNAIIAYVNVLLARPRRNVTEPCSGK